MLIENDINPHADEYINQWHGFREKDLWKNEMNDLYKPNIPAIDKLMRRFHEPRKTFLKIEEAV